MELDKQKAIKLVIVILATLAALAVMSTLVQLIQTVLPFLIVGAGIYAGYRWALGDAPAPTADEMEEQARGIFSRFRRTKKAVETTVKVGEALGDIAAKPEKAHRRRRKRSPVVAGEAKPVARADAKSESKAPAPKATSEGPAKKAERKSKVEAVKGTLKSNPAGAIEFKDRDVVISSDDVIQPDISRLEEKEKEEPEVTNNVLAQIEERRRRLQGGE